VDADGPVDAKNAPTGPWKTEDGFPQASTAIIGYEERLRTNVRQPQGGPDFGITGGPNFVDKSTSYLDPARREFDDEEHDKPRQASTGPDVDGEEVRRGDDVPMRLQELGPRRLLQTFGRGVQAVFAKDVPRETSRSRLGKAPWIRL
jgi:hypothetical protein